MFGIQKKFCWVHHQPAISPISGLVSPLRRGCRPKAGFGFYTLVHCCRLKTCFKDCEPFSRRRFRLDVFLPRKVLLLNFDKCTWLIKSSHRCMPPQRIEPSTSWEATVRAQLHDPKIFVRQPRDNRLTGRVFIYFNGESGLYVLGNNI